MESRLLIFTVFVCVSCGLTQIGGDASSGTVSGNVWGGPLEGGTDGGLTQVCYVTALDYQHGYDWKADPAKETVKCSLVVYADGIPVMKVPVGNAYETGSDPDMHRIVKGHLYTDYSTDSETVIKKDGQSLFRYPGRESLCGLSVIGDDVYTLGQNRNGEGFSLRRNGEEVIIRRTGTVLGPLREVGDSVSFAFYDMISSSSGSIARYYAAKGGKVTQIAVRDDVVRVWDAICTEDSVIYLATLTGVGTPVLFEGDQMTALPLLKGAVAISALLHHDNEETYVEIICRMGTLVFTSILKMDGRIVKTFDSGLAISSLKILDDGICCTANSGKPGVPGVIYRDGEQYPMPEGYFCMGAESVSMVNGILHVGLSSSDGGKPLLWKDSRVDTLNVNGYISSISAY